jgi:cytidine deaminase
MEIGQGKPIDDAERKLIETAQETLKKNYVPGRHITASAVLCASGNVFTGVDIETTGHRTCAEPVALGAAFTAGERDVRAIVTVCKRTDNYPIISPCGNCRQILVDYIPHAHVILDRNGSIEKFEAAELLPGMYIFDPAV